MTAVTTTAPRTSEIRTTTSKLSTAPKGLWKTGAVAGIAAGAATVAVVAVARALDVPVETAPGEAIPILGFAQLTIFFTFVGVLIARSIGRRATHPRSLFTKVTVALTALSLVPDVALSTDGGSKLTFVATHLVAAAIVIPALAGRLNEDR